VHSIAAHPACHKQKQEVSKQRQQEGAAAHKAPPLPLKQLLSVTDAHREGPRVSPRDRGVRCSITRAVVSPRSSDIAAAIKYEAGPMLGMDKAHIKQPPLRRATPVHSSSTSAAAEEPSSRTWVSERINAAQHGRRSADFKPADVHPLSSPRLLPPQHESATPADEAGTQQSAAVVTSSQALPGSREGDMPKVEADQGQVPRQGTIWLPGLGMYEKMTVAATVAGAVAGGVAAGPLGVSIGKVK
jgi:hypothetical protein